MSIKYLLRQSNNLKHPFNTIAQSSLNYQSTLLSKLYYLYKVKQSEAQVKQTVLKTFQYSNDARNNLNKHAQQQAQQFICSEQDEYKVEGDTDNVEEIQHILYVKLEWKSQGGNQFRQDIEVKAFHVLFQRVWIEELGEYFQLLKFIQRVQQEVYF